MRKTERRLRRKLSEGGGDCQALPALLALLSAEFRTFLACFTGYNCRAMSAGEFFALPPLFPPDPAGNDAGEADDAKARDGPPVRALGAGCLGPFFRNLDKLRYGGENPGSADVAGVLDELRGFTDSLAAFCASPVKSPKQSREAAGENAAPGGPG
jgi:hypothetical protein